MTVLSHEMTAEETGGNATKYTPRLTSPGVIAMPGLKWPYNLSYHVRALAKACGLTTSSLAGDELDMWRAATGTEAPAPAPSWVVRDSGGKVLFYGERLKEVYGYLLTLPKLDDGTAVMESPAAAASEPAPAEVIVDLTAQAAPVASAIEQAPDLAAIAGQVRS